MYQETYEVLSAALSLHAAYDQANADKKIDVKDLPFLMGPLMKLPGAFIGLDKVLPELKAMSPADRGELQAKLAAEYDIANDVLEAKVEAAIDWLVATGKFIGTLSVKPEVVPA